MCFSFCKPGAAGKLQPGAVACFICCHLWYICLFVFDTQISHTAKIYGYRQQYIELVTEMNINKIDFAMYNPWNIYKKVEFKYPINVKG